MMTLLLPSAYSPALRCVATFGLVMLLAATGCDRAATPHPAPAISANETSANEANAVSAVDEGSNDRDRLGRPLPQLGRAERIVSLSPSTTEMLFAIGLGDRIVGATKHCNYPAAALDIPRVGGGTMRSLSVEAIVAAHPDVVLCQWDSHAPLVESLDRLEIPAVAIGPHSIEELFEDARLLGSLMGQMDKAERLVDSMQAQQNQLVERAEAQAAGKKPRVFYEVWDSPLMTAGAGSFIDQLMQFAQFENIAGDIQTRYPRVSAETVIDRNPDVILAPTTHFESVDVEQFAARPGWSEVAAVKNDRIYLIDGDAVSRCGPRMLDALEQMLDAVYGEPTERGGAL